MAGKNDLFLTLSKTCGRVHQPTRCTYNLQPDLRDSGSGSLGVVIGQYSDVQLGRGELRLDNGCGGRAQFTRSVGGGFCQHSSYSRRQIPSDTSNCVFPKNSFLPRAFHYFHISQPAKNCQKNRYVE